MKLSPTSQVGAHDGGPLKTFTTPPRRRTLLLALAVTAVVATACTNQWWRPRRTTTTTAAITTTTTAPGRPREWPSWGHDLANSHYQPAEHAITPANVGRLKPKWLADLKGDISATPTIADGAAYVPDWGGFLSAVDIGDGSVRWQRQVTDYVVFGGVVSRTS